MISVLIWSINFSKTKFLWDAIQDEILFSKKKLYGIKSYMQIRRHLKIAQSYLK